MNQKGEWKLFGLQNVTSTDDNDAFNLPNASLPGDYIQLEILYNKEICHVQLRKRRFIRFSSNFYYKSGQWSADFITVVRVHKPSSCPTDYTFCFNTGSYIQLEILYNKEICHVQLRKRRFVRLSGKFYYNVGQWSADFITVVRVHKPSSCPTDYTFCFNTGSYIQLEILYNKEICHVQLRKRRFIRLSGKFYYNVGQWSADFITVVRVHKPSSCPTDYTFCFNTGSYIQLEILYNKGICHVQLRKRRFIRLSGKFYYNVGQWSADFITVVRVHKPSSCPTDYTFCFNTGSYI